MLDCPTCWTTKTEAGKCAGNPPSKVQIASMPPIDAPMTTISRWTIAPSLFRPFCFIIPSLSFNTPHLSGARNSSPPYRLELPAPPPSFSPKVSLPCSCFAQWRKLVEAKPVAQAANHGDQFFYIRRLHEISMGSQFEGAFDVFRSN